MIPLKGTIYSIEASESFYEISLCNVFASDHCDDPACNEQSYIYLLGTKGENPNYPYGFGNFLSFHPYTIPKITGEEGTTTNYKAFDLIYTNGNNIPAYCDKVNTTISFYCNIGQGRGDLHYDSKVEGFGPCSIFFRWDTIYACPECLPSDIVYDQGACIDGLRQITPRFTRSCNDWNVALPSIATQNCENLSVNRYTGLAVVGGVAVFLLLGLGLSILFFKQKREIENKYKQLKTDNNLGDSEDEEGLAQMDSPREEKNVTLEINANGDDDDEDPVEHDISLDDD